MRCRPLRACVLAGLVLVLTGCGAGEPAEVSLAELAFEADDHDGERIAAVGVVRSFTEADDDALEDHFAIEDADHNRVELVPHEAVADYVDREVRVVGEFRFDMATGRLLEVEEITPTGRPADLVGR